MLKLEPFKEEDFLRLIHWIDSEKLMYIFSAETFSYPLTHQQLKKYINAKDRIAYKVIDTTSGEIIGHADFSKINHLSKSARICSVVIGDDKHRNKGFGTQIINELVRVGFNEMKFHRIDLGVYDFNSAAIKCYEKCGFKVEGLLRENIKFKTEYWSTYNMSIINNN
ncbi:GNAT family N-acetyltransferase [Aureibaculum conchae]|uniref:GNAT family N-acetyltransferase n=1 Tax=Aureibaculum sp. 2308TA14-22 TaxID=3108392 RepID=UPI00339984E7